MAIAPFFDRVYAAAGRHLAITRGALEETLGATVVALRCGTECVAGNGRWIAELMISFLARLYPRIAIDASSELRRELEALAASINPAIEFVELPDPASGAVVVAGSVGDPPSVGIFPEASGWVARVRHHPSFAGRGPANPYSAGTAASLAAAELFRRTFLRTPVEPDFSLSLLNYGRDLGSELELGPVTLRDVAYVGLGAVGNGGLWAMARHAELGGRMLLVDHDSLSLSNLQRYALPVLADVGVVKVELAHRALSGTRLLVEKRAMTLDDLVDVNDGRLPCTDACISVDNVDGRRTAQAMLPRIVVNGWTGDSGLGASWHTLTGEAACLACLYHPRAVGASQTELVAAATGLDPARATLLWVTRQPLNREDIARAASHLGVSVDALKPWQEKPLGDLYTDVVCGAVPMDLKGIGRVEAVPLAHQSVLAGILMAAELVKRNDERLLSASQSEPLVAWEDVLRPPPSTWTRPRAAEPGCFCQDADYRGGYWERWREQSVPGRSPSISTPPGDTRT